MKRWVFALALSCGSVQAVGAAAQQSEPSRTVVQVTPYLWAAGIDGSISPFHRAPIIAIEKSFSDVMSDFNMGGFINLWGRRDHFVFSIDLMYVSTTDAHASGPLPAFQIPGLGVPIPPGATSMRR